MTATAPRTATVPALHRRQRIRLEPVLELSLGSAVGQCRAVPVRLGATEPRGFLAVYGADFEDDPTGEQFFYPMDTLKLALFTAGGEILWRKDLGRSVVPGLWFCPVLAFDLDGDVWDRDGSPIGNVGGAVAMASKLLDLPGEQLLAYAPDGTLRIWADRNAHDSPAALARYAHSFYRTNQHLTAVGYNLINLAGI